jgi:DNA repair protein RadB
MNTGNIPPGVKRIPLGCNLVDSMLGGGIETGSVTLFYGEAGCGKSNICMQMARNVIRSGKKVAYVDTEGLSYDRIMQIFKDESLVKQMLVFQVHSFREQSQRVDQIAKIANTGILGLIIIDSMTMFYRLNYDNMELRNDFIRQTEVLLNLARDCEVPVLITSQVYTNIASGSIEFLGGHAMHHNAKTIIRLDMRGNGIRTAVIIKHRSLPEGRSAVFRITDSGVSDP